MGRTHYVAGALATAALAPPTSTLLGLDLSPTELAIGVGIGVIAGVLPDIDHPDSLVTKGLLPGRKMFGKIGKVLGWYLSIPPRIVGVGARATMNHRGGTHSALFMLGWTLLAAPMYAAMTAGLAFLVSFVLGALAGVLPGPDLNFNPGDVASWLWEKTPGIMPLVMLSVFWGYFAHLLTDSMTKVPVPWPWPFSKRRLFVLPKGFRITTDSFVENRFIRPMMLVLAVAAFAFNIGVPLVQDVKAAGETLQQQDDDRD